MFLLSLRFLTFRKKWLISLELLLSFNCFDLKYAKSNTRSFRLQALLTCVHWVAIVRFWGWFVNKVTAIWIVKSNLNELKAHLWNVSNLQNFTVDELANLLNGYGNYSYTELVIAPIHTHFFVYTLLKSPTCLPAFDFCRKNVMEVGQQQLYLTRHEWTTFGGFLLNFVSCFNYFMMNETELSLMKGKSLLGMKHHISLRLLILRKPSNLSKFPFQLLMCNFYK